MSSDHRRFLLLEQGVGSALFNLVFNAGIAYLMFRHVEVVPFWGQQSIAGDTIGTTLLLPLITTLIVTPVARRRVRAGKLTPLGWSRLTHPALGWLPAGTVARGLVLGLICMVAFAPLTLVALRAFEVGEFSFWRFVAFKAGFAAFLATLVTPLIALWAIAVGPWSAAEARTR